MAINVIQGFNPSTVEPIDSRQLVADQTARYSIAGFNAYDGMIVYQQDTKVLWVLTDVREIDNVDGWTQVGSGGSSVKQFDGLITDNKGTIELINLYDPEGWVPIISGTAGQYQIDFRTPVLSQNKTHVQISAGLDSGVSPEVIVTWAFDYSNGPTRFINLYTYLVGTGIEGELIKNASITVKVYP
jgi:hypothetical protein